MSIRPLSPDLDSGSSSSSLTCPFNKFISSTPSIASGYLAVFTADKMKRQTNSSGRGSSWLVASFLLAIEMWRRWDWRSGVKRDAQAWVHDKKKEDPSSPLLFLSSFSWIAFNPRLLPSILEETVWMIKWLLKLQVFGDTPQVNSQSRNHIRRSIFLIFPDS